MLHIISLRAQISQNVKYWYEICDVLVPIFHALWRTGTNFSQCEICEMWNLRFNKAYMRSSNTRGHAQLNKWTNSLDLGSYQKCCGKVTLKACMCRYEWGYMPTYWSETSVRCESVRAAAKAQTGQHWSAGQSEPWLLADVMIVDISCWLVGFVALRPRSTAMVIAGQSVHLTTLFPGQAWTSG